MQISEFEASATKNTTKGVVTKGRTAAQRIARSKSSPSSTGIPQSSTRTSGPERQRTTPGKGSKGSKGKSKNSKTQRGKPLLVPLRPADKEVIFESWRRGFDGSSGKTKGDAIWASLEPHLGLDTDVDEAGEKCDKNSAIRLWNDLDAGVNEMAKGTHTVTYYCIGLFVHNICWCQLLLSGGVRFKRDSTDCILGRLRSSDT